MTAIDLYKFIVEHGSEYKWIDENVLLFVENRNIEDFHALLSASVFEDSGITCTMKDGYFCFFMQDICEHYGIELTDIFAKQ